MSSTASLEQYLGEVTASLATVIESLEEGVLPVTKLNEIGHGLINRVMSDTLGDPSDSVHIMIQPYAMLYGYGIGLIQDENRLLDPRRLLPLTRNIYKGLTCISSSNQ